MIQAHMADLVSGVALNTLCAKAAAVCAQNLPIPTHFLTCMLTSFSMT